MVMGVDGSGRLQMKIITGVTRVKEEWGQNDGWITMGTKARNYDVKTFTLKMTEPGLSLVKDADRYM